MQVRAAVVEALKEWNGELVEPKYTHVSERKLVPRCQNSQKQQGISASALVAHQSAIGVTSVQRLHRLRRLIAAKPLVRAIESTSGHTALLLESASVTDEATGAMREFDVLFLSALTQTATKGKPDTEVVSLSHRLPPIEEMLEVSTKVRFIIGSFTQFTKLCRSQPFIFDASSGGLAEHFGFAVRTLERVGVSGCVVHDTKRRGDGSVMQQKIETFGEKLATGRASRISEDFVRVASAF